MTSFDHLVRIGIFGHVGRFRSVDRRIHGRGKQVICRTGRGLEVGEVLANLRPEAASDGAAEKIDGDLLRSVTPDDQMLAKRLESRRLRAIDACQRWLTQKDIGAVLIDAEHLFDGESVVFYFLGEVPEQPFPIEEHLGEVYEGKAKFRQFTETLTNGCGPGCGAEASKCSSGACSSCGLSGGCSK